ncbi:MAG: nucleotidyltransferase domain-containing protein [Nanoarchaeota archaeon]|nr:nucleotidyltransferase domain-containing protein [Nanoarchaeota archaeon]
MEKPFVPKKYHIFLMGTSKQKVLKVLFNYPEKEFSLTDLAKEATVSKAHLGRILENLLNENIIQIIKLSKIWRIKANQSNPRFINAKIVYNLGLIYESGLVEFLTDHFKNPKAIILFGSFRKGDDISTSDIDIAVEGYGVKEYTILNSQDIKNLKKYESFLNKKIQIHLFNPKNADRNVFANILNGIVLLGFLEGEA